MPDAPDRSDDAVTTVHVRRARGGDTDSLEWLIARFTPWLVVQADYRLGRKLRGLYDPEDLVHDVWLSALPRVGALAEREGHYTRVLLRYLSAALMYRVKDLLEKHIRNKPARAEWNDGGGGIDSLAATVTGALTKAAGAEHARFLQRAIQELNDSDRELIVLRGIEQHPVQHIAALLGAPPNTVSVRYRRACDKLRAKLEAPLLDDLAPA